MNTRNDDYTTSNLLDYLYDQKQYKLIITNFVNTKQYKHSSTKQFYRIIRTRLRCKMFFIAEKQQKTILNFSVDSLTVTE